MATDVLTDLQNKAGSLQDQIARMTMILLQKENGLAQQEITLLKQKSAVPFYMSPGNVGDVNKVIWPFWFPTIRATVPAGQTAAPIEASFSVTQEAAFIIKSYTRAVFVKTLNEDGSIATLRYLDPDAPGFAGRSEGLSWSYRDASSTREFMNTPISLDHVGHPKFPTDLPAPQLVMPRSNINVRFTNSSDNIYEVFMSFFGVRVRIDEASNILSTVSASMDEIDEER